MPGPTRCVLQNYSPALRALPPEARPWPPLSDDEEPESRLPRASLRDRPTPATLFSVTGVDGAASEVVSVVLSAGSVVAARVFTPPLDTAGVSAASDCAGAAWVVTDSTAAAVGAASVVAAERAAAAVGGAGAPSAWAMVLRALSSALTNPAEKSAPTLSSPTVPRGS